jgi:serine/threonine protein kinase
VNQKGKSMAVSQIAEQADPQSQGLTKEPNAEPIPGYRLIEHIGSGGFAKVWKCEAPGGLLKAIKFVHGDAKALHLGSAPIEEELRAIERVKAIRHPFLLSMERVEYVGGELAIVLELADKSLQDLLAEYQQQGKPGIPRDELLGYLREAAEALDVMNNQHGLQHLDIKPRNLLLVSNHVKVADFGLVNSFGRADKQPGAPHGRRDKQPAGHSRRDKRSAYSPAQPFHTGAATPRYASPETFQSTFSPQSDQYSLAIVYQELLTGSLPFDGKNSRQLLLQHLQGKPDLSWLPAADRPIVERALAKNPQDRFPTCADFIRALQAVTPLDGSPAAPGQGAAGGGKTVANYRLISCLHSTPLTEVWKATSNGGVNRLVKFVYGFTGPQGRDAEEPVARLKALRHPTLAPLEVVQTSPGCAVLVTDLVEKTLRDRFLECLTQGLPGIPRTELLEYLKATAEVLNHLYQQHQLQHLGLNPRNILLDKGRLLLGDFGLVQLLWLPAGQPTSKLNGRYAAPELFQGQISPSCDQYTLALIYHEMLTGSHCQRGPANRPGPLGCAKDAPNLDRLPACDRPILARALDPNPERRWPTSLEMIRALEAGPADQGRPRRSGEDPQTKIMSSAQSAAADMGSTMIAPAPFGAASPVLGDSPAPAPNGNLSAAAPGDALLAEISVSLAPRVIRQKLDGLRQKFQGLMVGVDNEHYHFQIQTPRSFWQRWTGRYPGLDVQISLYTLKAPGNSADPASPGPTTLRVEIKASNCSRDQGAGLLNILGPLLLESVRTAFHATGTRRTSERVLWPYPLKVRSVYPDGKLGDTIECLGKDISSTGIGFYLPRELPTSQVRLHLPRTPQTPAATVTAKIMRVQGCGNGWYEVGGMLLPPIPTIQTGPSPPSKAGKE